MLDIMYEVPTMDDLEEVIITDKVILRQAKPKLKYKSKSGKKTA
jgi:ATP-dependent protease Clp ATPase subunit